MSRDWKPWRKRLLFIPRRLDIKSTLKNIFWTFEIKNFDRLFPNSQNQLRLYRYNFSELWWPNNPSCLLIGRYTQWFVAGCQGILLTANKSGKNSKHLNLRVFKGGQLDCNYLLKWQIFTSGIKNYWIWKTINWTQSNWT